MPVRVSAQAVKAALPAASELAFIDVREAGQFGEGHPLFAVPLPWSRFEPGLERLVPRRDVPIVLVDDGDGIAEKAAASAEAMGYRDVAVLDGGAPAWAAAGLTLYQGVNVPSKAFGELLEIARHTPRISAGELDRMVSSDQKPVILDGRTLAEFGKMSIPGGVCCPNGELALRADRLVPNTTTPIVVNCAGRTRSILGAQTLIDAGIPNPVMALENGTQGWFLAGLTLARGADARFGMALDGENLAGRKARVRERATSAGVAFLTPADAITSRRDAARTTYLLDVRTPEEFAAGSLPGAIHAPGGQLIQATDQWIAVRNARILLVDSDGVRAPMAAYWLRQMGHQADVVDGAVDTLSDLGWPAGSQAGTSAALPTIQASDAASLLASGVLLVDVRESMAYRVGHIAGARWAVRPRLGALGLVAGARVALVGEQEPASLVAHDLTATGCTILGVITSGPAAWKAAGLDVVATPDDPADADCIDYLFFTHDRHAGNPAAARQYLAWEIGLVDQLDPDERASFRIVGA